MQHRARARQLRKNLTDAERKLWMLLRRKQLSNFRFRRQVPMGHYILDFVCHSAKIVIEADGGQHNLAHEIVYDNERTAWIEREGYRVLRFWNIDILCHTDAVLETILKCCLEDPPHPNLPPQGGKELAQ